MHALLCQILCLGLLSSASSSSWCPECDMRLGIGADTELWNYEHYIGAGKEANLSNIWQLCVDNFNEAIVAYKEERLHIAECRMGCQSQNIPFELGSLFETTVRNALCTLRCEGRVFEKKPKVVDRLVEAEMTSGLIYEYLQYCYDKLGMHQEAASSAYTFLVHNPEHTVMQSNFLYYLDLPTVSLKEVRYLEAQRYQELYFSASKAHELGEFSRVVVEMESALDEYFIAEQQCRALCEGSLPVSPEASFVVSVAHHYTFSLRCKIKCPLQLSMGHGDVQEDLLPMFFHYLQYAYFKTGELKKACESVASYRLVRPNDTVMRDNENFYRSLEGIRSVWFEARQEVVSYLERYQHDREFLRFIDEEFNFNSTGIPGSGSKPDPVLPLISEKANQLTLEARTKQRKEWEAWARAQGFITSRSEKELNGIERVQVEFIASQEECRKLAHLVVEGAISGDGYNGMKSPHTIFEDFAGLTIANAVKLVQNGAIDPMEGQLFLDVSERSRLFVKGYFNVTTPLYFSFTHLVCRSSLPESPTEGRTDLSHPIHGDNCNANKEGECFKERPAYTWRDYSAILYLNDDFEGGEFVFAKTIDNVEAVVRPKCGRLVAFSSGKENLHGVRAVMSGRRCALAMWFTLDARYQERERIIAEQALKEAAEQWERSHLNRSRASESCESCSADNQVSSCSADDLERQ